MKFDNEFHDEMKGRTRPSSPQFLKSYRLDILESNFIMLGV